MVNKNGMTIHVLDILKSVKLILHGKNIHLNLNNNYNGNLVLIVQRIKSFEYISAN